MQSKQTGTAIIGAGSVGIAVAYYLARHHGITDTVLIDQGQPMAFTSAQSGENYRDWWPHAPMVRFMSRSIELMEDIALTSGNRISMTRRGYILATRTPDISAEVQKIHAAFGGNTDIRVHEGASAPRYSAPISADWTLAPSGFDILSNQDLIRSLYPNYDPTLRHLIHVRRAGDISGQQLGQYMLDYLAGVGVRRITGMVRNIAQGYALEIDGKNGTELLLANRVVNAAGPFAGQIAQLLDVALPIHNVAQQKIAFPDVLGTIPRNMPFSIDLDGQTIDWTEDEREALCEAPETSWLTKPMTGAIHCRPDGGDHGTWIKLGWAFNSASAEPSWTPPLLENFPEIVLRGAA